MRQPIWPGLPIDLLLKFPPAIGCGTFSDISRKACSGQLAKHIGTVGVPSKGTLARKICKL